MKDRLTQYISFSFSFTDAIQYSKIESRCFCLRKWRYSFFSPPLAIIFYTSGLNQAPTQILQSTEISEIRTLMKVGRPEKVGENAYQCEKLCKITWINVFQCINLYNIFQKKKVRARSGIGPDIFPDWDHYSTPTIYCICMYFIV